MLLRCVPALLLAACAAAAPPASPLLRLANPTPDDGDQFGAAVALADGALLVGAPLDDAAGPDAGAVHVFVDGAHALTLQPASPQPDAQFGAALASHGEWLFVGAPRWDGTGAVVAFRGSGAQWTEVARIMRPVADEDAWFGRSLAATEGLLVVGSPLAQTPAGMSGMAWAYELVDGEWEEAGELGGPFLFSGGGHGAAVAAGDGIAVVGAPYVGNQFIFGTAQVFVRGESGWSWSQELAGSLQQGRDRFGASVAVAGRALVVGSPRDSPPATGVLSTFAEGHGPDRGTWTESSFLLAPDATPFDRFGAVVASDGHALAVASVTLGGGEVHVFSRRGAGWRPIARLVAPDAGDFDLFGADVVLRDRSVVIGAPQHDGDAPDAGAVYVSEDVRRVEL